MKTRKKLTILTISLLAAAFAVMPGCEDDADTGGDTLDDYFKNNPYVSDPRGNTDSEVIIDPTAASVSALDEEVVFSARGGNGNYTWDLADDSAGTITPQDDNNGQAVYKVTKKKQNNIIVYDGNGDAAIADITSSGTPISISPQDSSISTNGGVVVEFIVYEGNPPYTWYSANHSLGTFSAGDTNSLSFTATYTSKQGEGENSVTVADSDGDTASTSITHE